MSLRSYVFVHKADDPQFWVDRYIGTGEYSNFYFPPHFRNPQTRDERLAHDHRVKLESDWNDVQAKVTARDPFGAGEWAAMDAQILKSDTGLTHLGPDFRAVVESGQPTSQFIHWCDLQLAQACIARAALHAPDEIDHMAPEAQRQAVIEMVRWLGAYFRALNVRPWGWAPFRGAWETAMGRRSYQLSAEDAVHPTSHASLVLNCHVGDDFSFLSSITSLAGGIYPDNRALFFGQRPTPTENRGGQAGQWWSEARFTIRGMVGEKGGTVVLAGPRPSFNAAPNTVAVEQFYVPFLGRRETIHQAVNTLVDASSPCGSANDDASPGARIGVEYCRFPCGEGHLLWITNDGVVTDDTLPAGTAYPAEGSNDIDYVRVTPWAKRVPRQVDPHDAHEMSLAWPSRTRGDWTTWAVSTLADDPFALMAHGYQYPRVNFVPPLCWYAQLFWPLVERVKDRDPLQVVYEVLLDVLGKNLWTRLALGEGDAALASVRGALAMRSVQGVRQDAGLALAEGAATAVVGMVNPIAGAILGSVLSLLNAIDASTGKRTGTLDADVFGRTEPVTERLAIWAIAREDDKERFDPPASPPGYDGRDPLTAVPLAAPGSSMPFTEIRGWSEKHLGLGKAALTPIRTSDSGPGPPPAPSTKSSRVGTTALVLAGVALAGGLGLLWYTRGRRRRTLPKSP